MNDTTAGVSARGELDEFLSRNPDVGCVDAMFPDMCGIIRGKRLTLEHARQLYAQGLQIPGSMLLLSVTGSCMDPMGRGVSDGDPDVTIRPIAGTLRQVPWSAQPRAQVQVAFLDDNGGPNPFDPREILASVLERFAELKLRPVVACELEFCLIDSEATADGWPRRPVSPTSGKRHDSTQLMSLSYVDDFKDFIEDATEACTAWSLPLTALNAEYGSDQFELNLRHVADAVKAADDAVSLKQIVQGVAARHGMRATFMAKPYAEKAGNGMHWHVSLTDEKGGNVFDQEPRSGGTALEHAVAGVLRTMHEGMAFIAPNVNSYKRFQPGLFVPMSRTWGYNNRSVALRIPAGNASDRRIEYRIPGADANPYLALAVLLSGIHHGLTEPSEPPPPSSGNEAANPDGGLPLKLYDALLALRKAKVLPEYLGRD